MEFKYVWSFCCCSSNPFAVAGRDAVKDAPRTEEPNDLCCSLSSFEARLEEYVMPAECWAPQRFQLLPGGGG